MTFSSIEKDPFRDKDEITEEDDLMSCEVEIRHKSVFTKLWADKALRAIHEAHGAKSRSFNPKRYKLNPMPNKDGYLGAVDGNLDLRHFTTTNGKEILVKLKHKVEKHEAI